MKPALNTLKDEAARSDDIAAASEDGQSAHIFMLTGRFPAYKPPRTELSPAGTEILQPDHARMLKTLLGNLDGMVYRCRDDEHWTMEFVSDGCFRLTGYQPGELLLNNRVSYEAITHAEDRERVRDAVNAAIRQRKRFDVEYRMLHADGGVRWVWERGTGVLDAAGKTLAIEGIIQDVTDRREAVHALREAERRYHSLFDNAVEGIFRTTPDGRYLDANPALARIYGFESPEELINTLRDIRRQLYVEPARREEFIRLVRARGSVSSFESQIYRKNGDIIWISENARVVFDESGNILLFEGTVEDITERKLYQARIEQQANYDTLTGLANRSLLNDRLQQAILTAARHQTQLAVAFIDLDRFKFVNDSLGHYRGDELLKVTAERLCGCVRDCDTVARLGGDEFVLLLAAAGDPVQQVNQIMDRVLEAVAQPWVVEQAEFNVSASIGIAVYPNDGGDTDTLLRHADSAMYRAKEQGGDNFQFFTNELNLLMTERLEMESKLRRALERQQFLLHYQARVDLASGKVVGAEALIRWDLPEQGLISPNRFIPVAEETGLIVAIGKWVLWTACDQAARWRKAGFNLCVSVNVSQRQFRQDNFVDTVAEVLAVTGLPPDSLELEVTESMVMHDPAKLAAMLDQLANLGVQIAVDDFGTGYSSLSYLKRFPVDHLKVDRSFVKDIATDGDDATIVKTIIALGHNLGLKVVAEGVETAEQLEFLRRNGCDEIQGYFFGKPMLPSEFEAFISKKI